MKVPDRVRHRVQHRLDTDLIGWLTTVAPDATPHTSPIWFLWDGDTFLLYSRPDKPKLRHMTSSPRVGFHLDGDGRGGDIVVVVGNAQIRPDIAAANEVEGFTSKYAERIVANGWTPQTFAADYSVPVVVTPRRWRAW